MPLVTYGPIGPARQRGVVSVLTAFLLVMLLTVLALVVDTGRLYLEQRNLQKVVDMAALDASARLPRGYCAGELALAQQFALESASLHGFTPGEGTTLTTQCVTLTSQDGLRQVTPNASSGAGVQVIVEQETPASLLLRGGALFSNAFSGSVSLSANASAQRSEPIAAFSISSRLLSLNNDKFVGILLSSIGLDVDKLEILGPAGVLDTSVSPAGLLNALGIDVSIDNLGVLTPESIVATSGLSVSRIIAASAELVGNNTLALQLQALSNDITSASLQGIDLFGDNGLIRLVSGSREGTRAALETGLDLGELLGLAVLAGSGERSVEIPGLNLLGISIKAGITEPPALAIGPVGTSAHTGQARLHIDIDTNKIVGLGLLTQLLGTRIRLPLTIDLARAEATLTKINCAAELPTVDIAVSSSLLEACVGEMPDDLIWTGVESCSSVVRNMNLITLLGTSLGSHSFVVEGAEANPLTFTEMAAGEERSYNPSTPLPLGTMITNIVNSLFNLLNNTTTDSDNIELTRQIATDYLEASKASNGTYNPAAAANLILNGGTSPDGKTLPSIADGEWTVSNYRCALSLLGICLSSSISANFSIAFVDMSNTTGLLNAMRNQYQACTSLLVNYNNCVRNNLSLILQRKPGGLDLAKPAEGVNTSPASCQTFICNLLRIPLNSVSKVLTDLISGGLGLELGRADVRVESISCGVPALVQ
ncbi:unnamed protein product [Ectocarpus sp. 12 AP-2014]